MWESENQDESPLMTTDNFHGIDRLGTGREERERKQRVALEVTFTPHGDLIFIELNQVLMRMQWRRYIRPTRAKKHQRLPLSQRGRFCAKMSAGRGSSCRPIVRRLSSADKQACTKAISLMRILGWSRGEEPAAGVRGCPKGALTFHPLDSSPNDVCSPLIFASTELRTSHPKRALSPVLGFATAAPGFLRERQVRRGS
jgi:hypothetical protein